MAYNALNNLIDAYIYANGVQAITGQILNGVLKQMVSQLGGGYHLMGVAGPATAPEQNDYAMAYFAATAGEYTDFGGITLAAGEVAVLLTSGNGSWSKQTIYNVPTGTADLENTANFITNAVTDLVNYYTKTEIDALPNGEDIDFDGNDKLQFANRVYNAQQPNGMGYKILRKDATFASQVTDTNTIYVVRNDFVLTANVTMPANCILEFDGGSISGEVTITGKNTGIKSAITKIFSTELTIAGSWIITEWFAEWFDNIPDTYYDNRDDHTAIQAALNAASSSGVKIVRLLDKEYYINTPLVVNSNCSLVGAEHKGTWSNTSSISSTGDAIHLNGTTAIENIIIKNIALFGNDKENGLQSHCGILADGNGVASIRNIITEDLFILYFKYGIKISNDNFNAISYIATKSVEITRCTVGIYFDGNCAAGTTPAWINYNIFRDCTITHNRCGGIALTNAKNMLNNIIDNCCIEGNGEYYFIDEYYENGAFGLKLYNRNASPSENNVVCNSYIENNNPHKGGNSPVASEGESSYSGIVSPDNWYKNKMCGTFVINQANISIDNCFISRQYRVISAIDNSYASLKNSSLSYTNKYFQDQITYPIFTTSSKYVANSFVADNLKIADNTPYYCPFEVIKGEYDATAVFNTGIDYKDELCHIYKPRYGSIKDGFYTLGNSEIFDPNLNNLGFGVGNTPIDNTAWLKYNCKDITDTKTIKCNVISDITSEEWQSADEYISDNMPDLYFYAEDTDASDRPKVQLGTSAGRFFIGSNIVFENLIIDLQNTSDSNTEYFFRVYRDKKTLTFKNCHIKYTDAGGGGALVLVYNSNHKFNIKFVNCTFEANVGVIKIINEDSISRLSKIECTEDMGPSFTTIPNICPKTQGNTAGRPVYVKEIGFCYFDNSSGINKPIYAKETDWTTGAVSWVDATGTAV